MIGVCFKNGIEIEHRDAEGLQIIEFFRDSVQIPSKEIIVEDLARFIGLIRRKASPVISENFSFTDGIISDLVEAIGKDLIHYAALHPFRRMIFFIVDGDLPAYQIYLRHKCAVAEVSAAEIFITDAEIIKIETGLMETERHTKSVFSAMH